MDWLGKAIGLPEEFLTFSEEASKTIDSVRNDDSETEVHNGKGGGVLQVNNYNFIELVIQIYYSRNTYYNHNFFLEFSK